MEAPPKVFIHQIVNSLFNSNTFVLYTDANEVIAIIDPGEADAKQLLHFLADKPSEQYYVILTHEHNDHIAGLETLCSQYKIKLVLSGKCFNNLNNPKMNLSEYLDSKNIEAIVPDEFYLVKDEELLTLKGFDFRFYETQGHSEGGVCIGLDKIIFTGDTVLQYKITTNFPGGSKSELKKSVEKLSNILPEYELIYPGHGEVYSVNDQMIVKSLKATSVYSS